MLFVSVSVLAFLHFLAFGIVASISSSQDDLDVRDVNSPGEETRFFIRDHADYDNERFIVRGLNYQTHAEDVLYDEPVRPTVGHWRLTKRVIAEAKNVTSEPMAAKPKTPIDQSSKEILDSSVGLEPKRSIVKRVISDKDYANFLKQADQEIKVMKGDMSRWPDSIKIPDMLPNKSRKKVQGRIPILRASLQRKFDERSTSTAQKLLDEMKPRYKTDVLQLMQERKFDQARKLDTKYNDLERITKEYFGLAARILAQLKRSDIGSAIEPGGSPKSGGSQKSGGSLKPGAGSEHGVTTGVESTLESPGSSKQGLIGSSSSPSTSQQVSGSVPKRKKKKKKKQKEQRLVRRAAPLPETAVDFLGQAEKELQEQKDNTSGWIGALLKVQKTKMETSSHKEELKQELRTVMGSLEGKLADRHTAAGTTLLARMKPRIEKQIVDLRANGQDVQAEILASKLRELSNGTRGYYGTIAETLAIFRKPLLHVESSSPKGSPKASSSSKAGSSFMLGGSKSGGGGARSPRSLNSPRSRAESVAKKLGHELKHLPRSSPKSSSRGSPRAMPEAEISKFVIQSAKEAKSIEADKARYQEILSTDPKTLQAKARNKFEKRAWKAKHSMEERLKPGSQDKDPAQRLLNRMGKTHDQDLRKLTEEGRFEDAKRLETAYDVLHRTNKEYMDWMRGALVRLSLLIGKGKGSESSASSLSSVEIDEEVVKKWSSAKSSLQPKAAGRKKKGKGKK